MREERGEERGERHGKPQAGERARCLRCAYIERANGQRRGEQEAILERNGVGNSCLPLAISLNWLD